LVDIMINHPELIYGDNIENIFCVIKIYCEIVDTKTCTKEIKEKIV